MNLSLKDKLLQNLTGATYKFAKSMPQTPHWYTLRDTWDDPKDFRDVVRYIRANGVEERFYSRTFIYLYYNGWKYWTMGDRVRDTILINKAEEKPF